MKLPRASLFLILFVASGIAAAEPERLRSKARDELAWGIALKYKTIDSVAKACVREAVRNENWRAKTLDAWLATNKPYLVSARAYLRQSLIEEEALSGSEARAKLEATMRSLLLVAEGSGLVAFEGVDPDAACARLEDGIRTGKFGLQSDTAMADLSRAAAPFVVPGEQDIEPLPPERK